jgi:transcriptional regulator with XRE-family HTH domain
VYCIVYSIYMKAFGTYIRRRREELLAKDRKFSVRQVAARIKVQPSYLSKVERGEQPPPSESKIVALARELQEDPDVLLALAGKISSDLKAIIEKRPRLFAELIRELKNMPDHAVLRLVREVRDGKW